jgi:IclR family acetate operon transcriptional repressor
VILAVKRSHSGSRVLTVLEAIARSQPIGIRALARLLDQDKSAVQRAVVTLADAGWIRAANPASLGWEVTFHILAVAHAAHGNNDLLSHSRPALERLRDQTGETVLLVVPDAHDFVIADVIESRQALRMVPQVGVPVAAKRTATGRAVLPFMSLEHQTAMLGAPPDRQSLEGFRAIRKRGYAISDGEINPAATNIAAPILEYDGSPLGAVVIVGPRERMTTRVHDRLGRAAARCARELSRGAPATPPSRVDRRVAQQVRA